MYLARYTKWISGYDFRCCSTETECMYCNWQFFKVFFVIVEGKQFSGNPMKQQWPVVTCALLVTCIATTSQALSTKMQRKALNIKYMYKPTPPPPPPPCLPESYDKTINPVYDKIWKGPMNSGRIRQMCSVQVYTVLCIAFAGNHWLAT